MSVVEKSKAAFSRYLDDEMLELVENLSVGDQAYFWAILYHEMPRTLNRMALKDMEESIRKKLASGQTSARDDEVIPISDMNRTIRPGAWFRAVIR